MLTPPDPTSGQTELVLDPLEWVHAVVAQIPDAGLHLTRSYGAYSNRSRKKWAHLRMGPGVRDGAPTSTCDARASKNAEDDPPDSEFVQKRKVSWARRLCQLPDYVYFQRVADSVGCGSGRRDYVNLDPEM